MMPPPAGVGKSKFDVDHNMSTLRHDRSAARRLSISERFAGLSQVRYGSTIEQGRKTPRQAKQIGSNASHGCQFDA
jgi:hypothetical protein